MFLGLGYITPDVGLLSIVCSLEYALAFQKAKKFGVPARSENVKPPFPLVPLLAIRTREESTG